MKSQVIQRLITLFEKEITPREFAGIMRRLLYVLTMMYIQHPYKDGYVKEMEEGYYYLSMLVDELDPEES